MELGLEWLESQRAVMYDEQYQDFFLRYTDGMGNKVRAGRLRRRRLLLLAPY